MYRIFVSLLIIVLFSDAQVLERQLVSEFQCHTDFDCHTHTRDSVCIGNTVENPGFCECKKNFIPQVNKTYFNCLSKAEQIDDPCEDDVQCQFSFSNWAECKNGRCNCRYGSHFADNKCYQSVKVGDICSFRHQCYLKDGTFASCLAGRCTCPIAYHSTSEGESCERTKYLGEDCIKQEECVSENSQCSMNICNCKIGYITSQDGQNCLQEANHLGEYCIEDSQCEAVSNFSYCEAFRCVCRNHHHKYNKQCYRSVKLNATCSNDRECWVFPETNETVFCKEGLCSCRIHYTDDGRRCVNGGRMEKGGLGIVVFIFVMMNFVQ